MVHFDDSKGIRRLITISNMKLEEVEDYYYSQFYKEDETKLKQKIKRLKRVIGRIEKEEICKWVLVIHAKGKMIGKIEVDSFADSQNATVKIEIPNEMLSYNYGVEAIEQFRKICKENQYFDKIILKNNEIAERYKSTYSMKNLTIKITA